LIQAQKHVLKVRTCGENKTLPCFDEIRHDNNRKKSGHSKKYGYRNCQLSQNFNYYN